MAETARPAPDAASLWALLDKQAMAEALVRYTRGVDRCDVESLKSAFWPDATVDYGSGVENAHAWAEALMPGLRGMLRTQHQIGNALIELDGDRAWVETYCRAYHEIAGPDGPVEMMVGGRYLDRFERRGDDWAIAHRDYVMDWNRNGPSTANWTDGLYATLTRRGGRLPQDPLYDPSPALSG